MATRFGFLVFPDVQQLDVAGPHEVFATAIESEIHLIWKDLEPVKASHGLVLHPSATFATCPTIDVLVVPGGPGLNAILEDDEVMGFLRERADRARYVTSVSTGALALGAAGLLRGRRATTHWGAHDMLRQFEAIPVDARIVHDGSLITAAGGSSGIDFALSILSLLQGYAEAETVQLMLEHAPAPPSDRGTATGASLAAIHSARDRMAELGEARAILARHPQVGADTLDWR